MIDLYTLRQFTAFAQTGTLSEAAELFHLSQPALSRNMKKLESDLGLTLFVRAKNKIELNDNGKYLLSLAEPLLLEADSLTEKVQDFDRKSRTITFGICSPAPAWLLIPFLTAQFPYMSLQTDQATTEKLLSGLDHNVYQLIVLPQQPQKKSYVCKPCGQESLMFALPKGHPYEKRKSLSFSDMNGENMLLMPDIGFWSFVKDRMPDSRFLTQSDRFSFNELVQASSLPSFATDLSEKYRETVTTNRTYIPVSDPEATVTYYLICKAEHKKMFQSLFQSL